MSGICGIINFDKKLVSDKQINIMLDKMPTRGNDDRGIQINDEAGFGHRMFWTTPEALHEKQPQRSQDNNLILTADARIDNRKEVIEKLNLVDSSKKIITDADLILLAYQKWEEDCLGYLIGDFSFTIWDIKKQQLFCVRDRLGIRSFNYFFDGTKFVFATEISTIFSVVGIKKILNHDVVSQYLKCTSVPKNKTFFEHIRRLPPASYLIITSNGIEEKKYWDLRNFQGYQKITLEDASLKFKQLFEESIQSCMRSIDSTIGCELSGGLDSSSVLSIASQLNTTKAIIPLSMRFDKQSCDESSYSDAVGKKLNKNILKVDCSKIDYRDEYSLKKYYHKFSDWPSMKVFMTSFSLFEKASEMDLRIVLTGQGGDHIMVGSGFYFADNFRHLHWIRLGRELLFSPYRKYYIRQLIIKPLLSSSTIKVIKKIRNFFYPSIPISDDFAEDCGLNKAKHEFTYLAQWDEFITFEDDFHAYWAEVNPYQYSGAYNLEFRHPFFSSRLIEFMFTLPPEFKFYRGKDKYLLRYAMKGLLPEEIRQRSDKAEFSEVVYAQINTMDHLDFIVPDELKGDSLIKQDRLDILLSEYKLGKQSDQNNDELWNYVNFIAWYKNNFVSIS